MWILGGDEGWGEVELYGEKGQYSLYPIVKQNR
jgi:hypothetical protein